MGILVCMVQAATEKKAILLKLRPSDVKRLDRLAGVVADAVDQRPSRSAAIHFLLGQMSIHGPGLEGGATREREHL